MKKLKTRAISAFLAIAMTATMLPTAFAENGAELEATVFMTVSNQGILAVDNDGAAMAGREVVVTDLDSDGKLTYHEALIAAHKTYHSEDGYSAPGGYVGELWGAETTNALFFINDEGLATGVSEDTIADGDRLTASINRDNTYYADWYSFFDVPEKSVAAGEEFSLILKGHLGMAYTDEDKVDAALGGISVGLWENGAFSEIEATDDEGRVTLSFAEEGTYYISAQGSVEDVVTDYSLMNMSTDDAPVFGVMDLTTYETQMAYTETDYGDGPYPADEVKYVDFEVWNESQDTYHQYVPQARRCAEQRYLLSPGARPVCQPAELRKPGCDPDGQPDGNTGRFWRQHCLSIRYPAPRFENCWERRWNHGEEAKTGRGQSPPEECAPAVPGGEHLTVDVPLSEKGVLANGSGHNTEEVGRSAGTGGM